jgi:hypothetical protein
MDAPSGPVDVAQAEELERLRRRAYGPDADIAGDAGAQARLAELEAAQRGPGADADTPAAATATPKTPPSGGALAEGMPWWHHRRRLVLLGVGVTALALVAGYAAGASGLLDPGRTPIPSASAVARMPAVPDDFQQGLYPTSPHEILSLVSVGAEVDRPNDRHGVLASLGIGLDQLRRYEDFDGLNVWSGVSHAGMTCVFVAVPRQGLREGYSGEGCAPEGFNAMAELPRQGSTTIMRFVLKDNRVDVLVYDRAVRRTWAD